MSKRTPRFWTRTLLASTSLIALSVVVLSFAGSGLWLGPAAADKPEAASEAANDEGTAAAPDTSDSSAVAAVPKGDAKKGKKSYKIKCVACHKANGSGGFKVTKNKTPDWRDAKRMADPQYDDEFLRDCIVNGKIESGMVAWGKQGMKADEVENLIAYIRTFSAPKDKKGKKGKKK